MGFVRIGREPEERPRCLACGTLIDGAPEAETIRRRGRFAVVVSWRVCPCGAFARSQRVRKLDPRAGAARDVDATRTA